jgi:acetyltransferase-like isoleucine patch superfamily enzyme
LQVGAIITLPSPQERETNAPADGRRYPGLIAGIPDVSLRILGNNLLERTTSALRTAGVNQPTVLRDGLAFSKLAHERFSKFGDSFSAWEQSLAELIEQGFELLVLIGTSAYTDLDYEELVRFHVERGAAMTQVYTADGPLQIAVISTKHLRERNLESASALSAVIGKRERFSYSGYVNYLCGPGDFVQLMEDALYRRCGLRPAGVEIANGVWFADGAEADDSCVIGGPSFIGVDTRIAACCHISGGSAIESACHVDSGSTIERSWILPGTYVGVGLNVHRSIVSKQKIFHLDRRTEITITDRRLIGPTRSVSVFGTGERLFNRTFSSEAVNNV